MTASRAVYVVALAVALCLGTDLMCAGPGVFAFERPSLFIDGRTGRDLERTETGGPDIARDATLRSERSSATIVPPVPRATARTRAQAAVDRSPALVLKIPPDSSAVSEG